MVNQLLCFALCPIAMLRIRAFDATGPVIMRVTSPMDDVQKEGNC